METKQKNIIAKFEDLNEWKKDMLFYFNVSKDSLKVKDSLNLHVQAIDNIKDEHGDTNFYNECTQLPELLAQIKNFNSGTFMFINPSDLAKNNWNTDYILQVNELKMYASSLFNQIQELNRNMNNLESFLNDLNYSL